MKGNERVLHEIDPNNPEKSLAALHAFISSNSKNKSEVEAVSLMCVRDFIDPRHTDKELRDNGYVLTVAQFEEDCEKFLRLVNDDPISYNSRLKRLHHGFNALIQQYTKGQVRNKVVIEELSKRFAIELLSYYNNSNPEARKLPDELRQKIANMFEIKVEKLNEEWIKKQLGGETGKEFNEFLVAQLLKDWQSNALDSNISKQLVEEKNKINTVGALLAYFQDNKLPNGVQEAIKGAIIEELKQKVEALQITTTSALGSEIQAIKLSSLRNDNYFIMNKLIDVWQNQKTSGEVTRQFEDIAKLVIEKMKPDLETRLVQQFEQIATKIFLEKVQEGAYYKELHESVRGKTLAIAKQSLLPMLNSDRETSKCKEAVYKDVMGQLHDGWVKGQLSERVADFLKDIVFSSLKGLDKQLTDKVWSNNDRVELHALRRDMAEMIAAMKELKGQITPVVPRFESSSAATSSAATTADAKALPSSAFNFFSSKP